MLGFGKNLLKKAFLGFQDFLSSSNDKFNLLTELSFLAIISMTASLLLTVLMQHTLITSS